jgi:hypothetical protein
MPLTQQLSEKAERQVLEEDLTLPPGGRRSGHGAASVLPYLTRSLQSKPGEEREPAAAPQRNPAEHGR